MEKIAAKLGRPIELEREERHTFPTPEIVLEAGVEPLAMLGLGLQRHSRIIAATERIRDGRLELHHPSQPQVCYAEAKRRLMGCYGIGHKVADCISLFALDKMEAFPVDRWVERPYRIIRKSGEPFVMAGLWETWKDPQGNVVPSCTIITTAANDLLSPIHDRMPAILPRQREELWLDSGMEDATSLTGILAPYQDECMDAYEVSTMVNYAQNDSPEVIARIG